MDVSVVITVFNERNSILQLLDSLARQTRTADEVVICDGGSTDGTVDAICSYADNHPSRLGRLEVCVEPGANISRGRNLAISRVSGPIIAATDAGVRLTPGWLESITAPWTGSSNAAHGDPLPAVAGCFVPEACGVFQTAMAATVLPLPEDIVPDRFLPSSRSVAFLKSDWERAGGYPEWLDYCEDLVFDLRLNALSPRTGTAFAWAPDAVVYFRPRPDLGSFWLQYYRYARGDGKADLWRKRHAVRYAVYGTVLPLLAAMALRGGWLRFLGIAWILIGIGAYCRRPWQRLCYLGQSLSLPQSMKAAALVPVIRAVGDAAKMVGYPVGLVWRWRNRKRQEIYWQRKLGELGGAVNRRP